MQNMQQNPTETTAPTLADLLTARRAQLEAEQIERERREQRDRERERLEALASIETFAAAHFSPTLAAALRILPAVDDALIAIEHDEPDLYHDQPGYLMLDIDSAGADDGDDARADRASYERPHQRWSLRQMWTSYRSYGWTLHGPNGYAADLGAVYSSDELLDARLLDAIAAYPMWLATAEERAEHERVKRAQVEAQAREERARRQTDMPHYHAIYGGSSGGILDDGRRVSVTITTPNNGILEFAATVEDATDTWLLFNVASAQHLIPVVRIVGIRPLPDLAPDSDHDVA